MNISGNIRGLTSSDGEPAESPEDIWAYGSVGVANLASLYKNPVGTGLAIFANAIANILLEAADEA